MATYEKHYETMEGTARYVEYKLCSIFATRRPDNKLLGSDTSFKSFNKFRNFNLEPDPNAKKSNSPQLLLSHFTVATTKRWRKTSRRDSFIG